MADTRIAALTELTAPDAADEMVIVDKSDTSMAATGTDKRITYATLAKLLAPPACRVYNSTNISHTTSGTLQAVTFDSERYDTDSMHSTSSLTSRLTAVTAGVYLITATVAFAVNATGSRELRFKLNGTTYIAQDRRATAATQNAALAISTIYKLAANDYVEVEANQSSGGALDMLASLNFSPEFGMVRVATG